MIKKLLIYYVLRFFQVLSNPKQAIRLVVIGLIVVGAFYVWQDMSNQKLLKAASQGDVTIIQEAVDRGAEVRTTDPVGRTPLHLAARYSGAEAVRILLEMGADVNAVDDKGRTPLHMTRFDNKDNFPTIKLLLEYGANPMVRDQRGMTPFDVFKASPAYTKPIEDLLKVYTVKWQVYYEANYDTKGANDDDE